ncbi:MAG: hypothetical protein JWP06_1027 [Candidatus Saccharibacteria bacterium]|nr:hypothetical protein [Candidatus Saccharibacteria bacterium]
MHLAWLLSVVFYSDTKIGRFRSKDPIQKVRQALTDAVVAEQWGAAPARVDAREGGI